MSLSDLIFAQKGILLTIGLVVLLLLIAGVIAAVPYVQRLQAQHQARQAKRKAQARAAAIQRRLQAAAPREQTDPLATEVVAPLADSTVPEPAPSSMPSQTPMNTSPAAVPQPVTVTPVTVSGTSGAAAAAQANQTESDNKDAPSSAMQDLLSSVFSDEEGEARRETLLKGLDHIDISHLLGLCNRVVSQLQHGSSASK